MFCDFVLLCSQWIQENINGIIVGLIPGIILGIPHCVSKVWKHLKMRRSAFTGWWEQLIYDKDDEQCTGTPVKTDYYYLRHVKNKYTGDLVINMEGEIWRRLPYEGRVWNVCGYLADDVLTLLYRAREGMKSRGCIYVKMQSNDEFKGFYLEEHEDGKIDKTPLIIKRVTDEIKIKELRIWKRKIIKTEKIKSKLK